MKYNSQDIYKLFVICATLNFLMVLNIIIVFNINLVNNVKAWLTFVLQWTCVTVINNNMFLCFQLSIIWNCKSTNVILKINKTQQMWKHWITGNSSIKLILPLEQILRLLHGFHCSHGFLLYLKKIHARKLLQKFFILTSTVKKRSE